MADFCINCAKEMGFEQDFNRNELLEKDYGYWEICEGCGLIFVDGFGNILQTEKEVKNNESK
jgi:hypothetical protein